MMNTNIWKKNRKIPRLTKEGTDLRSVSHKVTATQRANQGWLKPMRSCNHPRIAHYFAVRFLFLLLIISTTIIPEQATAQIRSGNAFLKIFPGVRNQGLAGSFTGVIDEMHTLFANPAATGFLREWQWSSSYTEWIADNYSLSWIYGRQLNTPWSTQSKFALGIHYLGFREFNSTGDPALGTASSNDALFTLSAGNPLNFLSPNLSFGTNLKYFRSDLGGLVASSWIVDLGLLYRSNRYKINLFNFDYAIFSAGAAINQLGQPLRFISVDTPLPRAFRAGAAVNVGSHEGLQLQLAADYNKVRDEDGRFSFGAEVSWRYLLGVRGGYDFNDQLLNKFSLGLSYRLANAPPIPGKRNAMRFDFAYLEGNEFFSPPLRGGLNHYPIGPEKFDLNSLTESSYLVTDSIALSWETARDPDLYDEVQYRLVLVKDDKSRLQNLVAETRKQKEFPLQLLQDNHSDQRVFLQFPIDTKNTTRKMPGYQLIPAPEHEPGDYYWTVLAYDLDQHPRFANQIGHFKIKQPEPEPVLPPPIVYDLKIEQSAIYRPRRPKVLFNFDKFTLTEPAKAQLDILANALESPELSDVFVKLGGHTDQRGSAIYNRRLSQSRVNAVGEYFEQAHQVGAQRLFAYGYGEKYPLEDAEKYTVTAELDSIHQLNRRVDIHLLRSANRDTTNQPIRDEDMVKAVFQGEPIQYILTITNEGPDTATAITVKESIPTIADFVTGSYSTNVEHKEMSVTADSIIWTFAAIPPAKSIRLNYSLIVKNTLPTNPYRLENRGSIEVEKDSNHTNNSTVDVVYIIPTN